LRVFAHLPRQHLQALPLCGKDLWGAWDGKPAISQAQYPALRIVDRARNPDGNARGLDGPQAKADVLELKMTPVKRDTRLRPQAAHEGDTFLKDLETVREVDPTAGKFARNRLSVPGHPEAENEARLGQDLDFRR